MFEPTPVTERSHTVLVVDDDSSTREMLAEWLGVSGMRVITAAGAAEALRLFDDTVDLVITDYAMPGEDGLSLLRSLATRRGVPCVLMSGQCDGPEILSELDSRGTVVFLRKPFALRPLLILVRRALASSKAAEVDTSEGDTGEGD